MFILYSYFPANFNSIMNIFVGNFVAIDSVSEAVIVILVGFIILLVSITGF